MSIQRNFEGQAVDFAPIEFIPRRHYIKSGLTCGSFFDIRNQLIVQLLQIQKFVWSPGLYLIILSDQAHLRSFENGGNFPLNPPSSPRPRPYE